MALYPLLRDVQSRFGGLLETKARLQRTVRRTLKKPFEHDFKILERLDIGERLCLDVGGNRGQSIDAIRLMQPDCEIISIEPSALLANALKKSFKHDAKAEVLNIGLGDISGEFTLYTPFYRNFMYDGLASFDEDEARSWLNADTVWRFNPALLRMDEHICAIKTLDSLNLDPAFIKLDVQGFERQVMIGGRETIARNKPLILMENNEPGDEWLIEMGWHRAVCDGARIRLDEIGGNNTLYLHPESDAYATLVS